MADESGADVAYLRTVEDNRRLRDAFASVGRIVIIGGGWIGLEVAAAARTAGVEVTVVEMQDLPLLGVLGPEVAQVFADLHREHGVDLRLGVGVDGIDARTGVRASSGSPTAPRSPPTWSWWGSGRSRRWAGPRGRPRRRATASWSTAGCGPPTPTSTPPATSPATNIPSCAGGSRSRHWDNAIHQARAAARVMLGEDRPVRAAALLLHRPVRPRHGVRRLRRSDGSDEVVLRGDLATRVFTAFWLQDGRVLAAIQANDWDLIDPIRGIIGR